MIGKILQYYLICLCITSISMVTLFVEFFGNISPYITPKKIGMFIIVAFSSLIFLFTSKWTRIKTTVTWNICLIICVFIFIEYFIIYGISFQLIFPLICMMLFFLWTFWVEIIEFNLVAIILICFACILSLQGLCQYWGILSSLDYNYPITGSFDNPAGFSSALSCLFPLCLFYYKDNHRRLKYASWIVSSLIVFVIILSESRAGILAVSITFLIYYLITIRSSRKTKIILVSVSCVLLILLYLWKKDSADGRLLIWMCALDMFMDKPIIGHGINVFQAKYMLYQGEYFKIHPDSSFALLADNVNHPFNECVLILIEHGLVGLAIVVLIIFLFIRAYLQKPDKINLVILLSLLALAIFSFFSYPFRYPFSWFILFMNITYLCRSRKREIRKNDNRLILFVKKLMVTFILFVVLFYSSMMWKMEIAWSKISQKILVEPNDELLSEYGKMHSWLGQNGLFLYNYAAELHQAKKYSQSIYILTQCVEYYNDMYVQLLFADCYYHNKDYQRAEFHYKLASDMCPSRYVPIYQLVKLYKDIGRNDEALALAKQILEKDIKVESSTVYAIKYEMKKIINGQPR